MKTHVFTLPLNDRGDAVRLVRMPSGQYAVRQPDKPTILINADKLKELVA